MAITLVATGPHPVAIVLVTTTAAAPLHPAMTTTIPANGATAPRHVVPLAVPLLTSHTLLAVAIIAMILMLLLLLVVDMRVRMRRTGITIGRERGPRLGATGGTKSVHVIGDSSSIPTGEGAERASEAYRIRTSIDSALSSTDLRYS